MLGLSVVLCTFHLLFVVTYTDKKKSSLSKYIYKRCSRLLD